MSIDTALFQQQLRNVSNDEDAADLLFKVVGQPLIQAEAVDDYVAAIREIPPTLRCLYFAVYMDIGVASDGFPGFICWCPYEDLLYEDIARGLKLIGATQMEKIFREAIDYLHPFDWPEISQMSFLDMDKQTGDIHGRYFQQHKQLRARVGRYLRLHSATLFDTEEA